MNDETLFKGESVDSREDGGRRASCYNHCTTCKVSTAVYYGSLSLKKLVVDICPYRGGGVLISQQLLLDMIGTKLTSHTWSNFT